MKIKIIFSLLLVGLLLQSCQNKRTSYIYNKGFVFGTEYNIKYQYKEDLQQQIQAKLNEVNASLSTYDSLSVLSKINRNIPVVLDEHFIKVFQKALQISTQTRGAFDMTVAHLVNVWGFGFKKEIFPTDTVIDSLMQYLGYKKIHLKNNSVSKDNPNVMIDASAIAKGYGVDVVADFLESKSIKNYMVEIGGEIRLKGKNPKRKKWTIAIDKPINDSLSIINEYQDIIVLDKGALATSGNYRRFYYKNKKKYSHTIDPHTGYPVQHHLLSVSVYAHDCMSADAYATAFMVMGKEKTIRFLQNHKELEAYLIYSVNAKENKIWKTKGFKAFLKANPHR